MKYLVKEVSSCQEVSSRQNIQNFFVMAIYFWSIAHKISPLIDISPCPSFFSFSLSVSSCLPASGLQVRSMWASCCNWFCLDSAPGSESNSGGSTRNQAYTNSGYSSYPSPTAVDHTCKACGGRFDTLARKVSPLAHSAGCNQGRPAWPSIGQELATLQ